MNKDLFFALSFFLIGHILAWYSTNLQFISEWWKERSLLLCLLISIPCSLSWFYGSRLMMEWTPQLWTARLTAFALSYLTFPLMTWYYLSESPFTPKTLICSLLAFTIVMVQIFIK
mgnify:FL=1